MKLLPRLRELVVEGGGDPDDIVLRTVEMPEASEAAWFLGSPTVRIHGGDVEPGAGDRDDFGLKCRIYRPDEGQTPTPPEDWIRVALAKGTRGELPNAAVERERESG
ncbi:MAG: hypothetical protein M3018_07650 [Actinomycetota bacterium]|nr:hypothetical protein [Actinomycetota bacterium]